ncbi:MAG: hypothetical protein ACKV2Q_25755 [Planctomycetaceae bacterium]
MATKIAQLEERLRKLEAEVHELKTATGKENPLPWYRQAAGQFKDDPVFDEIVRLGKEIRDAERTPAPVVRKRPVRRKGT